MRKKLVVLVRGGGEVASGIAYRLHLARFRICLTEVANPVAVTRGTTFCEAVYDGVKEVMGAKAVLVPAEAEAVYRVWREGNIAIVIDPKAAIRHQIKPDVLVDAIMAKGGTDTKITDAPLVIGVGPGFYAGRDVHLVVESNHSASLGKVILEGEAEANTGDPVPVGGLTRERVIWSPEAGIFTSDKRIGDSVSAGEVIAHVNDVPLRAPLSGILRGLIRSGVRVSLGSKLIEVDQVNDKSICYLVASKVMAIGGGVLEAIKMRFKE